MMTEGNLINSTRMVETDLNMYLWNDRTQQWYYFYEYGLCMVNLGVWLCLLRRFF